MYYLCSENKGDGQLRDDREADLYHCFSYMQIVGFPMMRLNYIDDDIQNNV